MNPLERKEKFIEILKVNKALYMEGIPVIGNVNYIEVRSAEERAKRNIVCNLLVEPYLLLLADLVDKDKKVYEEFSSQIINILKIEEYIVFIICDLMKDNDRIKVFIKKNG